MIRRLAWLVFFLALAAAIALAAGLRTYRAFTHEEQVAVIECLVAAPGSDRDFVLKFRPVDGDITGPQEIYPMRGEQWTVGGDFLKWAPWLTVLGAQPMHKLTRLESRYLTAGRELSRPRSAYDLNGGSSAAWRWLHRFGPDLPLVDAVYGSAVYTDARRGGRWGVYVTPSGYLLRPLR